MAEEGKKDKAVEDPRPQVPVMAGNMTGEVLGDFLPAGDPGITGIATGATGLKKPASK